VRVLRSGAFARGSSVVGSGRREATDGAAGQASFNHAEGPILAAGRLSASGPGPGNAEMLCVAETYDERVMRADPAT
jgi:hypothetical protein